MEINADLSKRAVVDSELLPWNWSPDGSVQRRMLDRDGGEVARATSIVRYPAGSSFPEHLHGGGEEFLVLEGTFCDENGAYPAGTYVRNPPGSRHSPFSAEGCTIFVKLMQFDPDDARQAVIETGRGPWRGCGRAAGLEELELHRFGPERVVLMRAVSNTVLDGIAASGGAELLVLDGGLRDDDRHYGRGAWLRLPAETASRLAVETGTRLYLKTGHLPAGDGG